MLVIYMPKSNPVFEYSLEAKLKTVENIFGWTALSFLPLLYSLLL